MIISEESLATSLLSMKLHKKADHLPVHRWCIFTLWSMTPVYPSSVGIGTLCGLSGFFEAWTGSSECWDDNDEADEEDDLPPELLLYTNTKLVTMVMMMMPPTPWHWKDTWKCSKRPEKQHRDRAWDFKISLFFINNPFVKNSLLIRCQGRGNTIIITAALFSCKDANEMLAVSLKCTQHALSTF